jgi:hypothetical protein
MIAAETKNWKLKKKIQRKEKKITNRKERP